MLFSAILEHWNIIVSKSAVQPKSFVSNGKLHTSKKDKFSFHCIASSMQRWSIHDCIKNDCYWQRRWFWSWHKGGGSFVTLVLIKENFSTLFHIYMKWLISKVYHTRMRERTWWLITGATKLFAICPRKKASCLFPLQSKEQYQETGRNVPIVIDNYFFTVPNVKSNINPSRPNLGQREKINLNFYFHTSLQCLKRFSEGL